MSEHTTDPQEIVVYLNHTLAETAAERGRLQDALEVIADLVSDALGGEVDERSSGYLQDIENVAAPAIERAKGE